VNVPRGIAWWVGGSIHPDSKMNILNGNCDFSRTKNLDKMEVNSKNIFLRT
jgi:hypothetical protein